MFLATLVLRMAEPYPLNPQILHWQLFHHQLVLQGQSESYYRIKLP